MEGASSSRILNPNRPCDICGDDGWLDGLMTCFNCQLSREHIYCMRKNLPGPPEEWSCEACSRSESMNDVQLPSKNTENLQAKLGSPPSTAARSSRSSRDYLKVVATGKVKYLAAEDVVKLSSGVAAATARMGSPAGYSRNMNHVTSRKDSASVFESSKRFSKSPIIVPSQHTSPGGHCSISVPSRGRPITEQPQVIKTSLQSQAGKPRIRNSDAEAHRSSSNWSRPIDCSAKEKHDVTEMSRKDKSGTKVIKSPVLREEGSFSKHVKSPVLREDGSFSKHVKSPVKEFVLPEEESVHISSPHAKQSGTKVIKSTFLREEGSFSKHVKSPVLREDGSFSKHVKSPVKESVLPERESVHVSSPHAKQSGSSKHGSSSKECEMLNIFENGLPDHLSINATWKGSFEIMGTALMDGSYEGFQAYPPRKVHVKASNVFNKMPGQLQFNLHPRSDASLGNFNGLCPTKDDIALYFLPGADERSRKNYHILSDFILERDMTMRSCLNDVELLIFTSKKLPKDCQKIKSRFYLCGVFRSVKKHHPSSKPSERSQYKDKNCSLRSNCNSDADRLKRRPSPKPSESSQHEDRNCSLRNIYDSDFDLLNHHLSPKPSERSQHKDNNSSLPKSYDFDADRLKQHPSPKPSARSQHKDKNCSLRNNYDSDADRLKHHPSPKPSENSRHKDKNSSLCNNHDADTDRLKHHPCPKSSERSQRKDKDNDKEKNYSLCNNYDTDVDHLNCIRGGDSMNCISGDESMRVDMDIDMVGGKDVGRIDKVVPKSNCAEKKIQFDVRSTNKVCSITNAFKFHKSTDDSVQQPLSTIKTEQPEFDIPPGFSRPTTADAAISEASPGYSRPATADAAISEASPGYSRPTTADAAISEAPPGFSRPTTADAAISEAPPGFLRPTTADAAILEAPPGFSRPTTADAAISEAPPGFSSQTTQAALLEAPPGFSSKRKRSCLNDASTSEYFQVSTLQRQKHLQVSDSEFPSQNHQVADHCPQKQSTSSDHKPAAEKEKSSECTRDGVHRIIKISNEDPPKEDDCSDNLKLTLRYDDGVGGWQAH